MIMKMKQIDIGVNLNDEKNNNKKKCCLNS